MCCLSAYFCICKLFREIHLSCIVMPHFIAKIISIEFQMGVQMYGWIDVLVLLLINIVHVFASFNNDKTFQWNFSTKDIDANMIQIDVFLSSMHIAIFMILSENL